MALHTGIDVIINYMTSFPINFDNVAFRMASRELRLISAHAQAYILKEEGFIVDRIVRVISKSMRFVLKWSTSGTFELFLIQSLVNKPASFY